MARENEALQRALAAERAAHAQDVDEMARKLQDAQWRAEEGTSRDREFGGLRARLRELETEAGATGDAMADMRRRERCAALPPPRPAAS